jgi:hypothetical protein
MSPKIWTHNNNNNNNNNNTRVCQLRHLSHQLLTIQAWVNTPAISMGSVVDKVILEQAFLWAQVRSQNIWSHGPWWKNNWLATNLSISIQESVPVSWKSPLGVWSMQLWIGCGCSNCDLCAIGMPLSGTAHLNYFHSDLWAVWNSVHLISWSFRKSADVSMAPEKHWCAIYLATKTCLSTRLIMSLGMELSCSQLLGNTDNSLIPWSWALLEKPPVA